MLTRKQKDLLLFIHERMSTGEIAPSFDEMRDALKLKSKSGIHRLITALVERGYLERLPHRARALAVKKLPEGIVLREGDSSPAAIRSREIRSVYESLLPSSAVVASRALQSVPLYGNIAAGTPIEALRDEGRMIELPTSLLGKGEHYALTIKGDSMTGMGIHDGDTVVIKRCDTAEDGAVVVALVDGEEATLKRIKRAGGKAILIAENEAYPPRELESSRVRIQGRLVSLLRTYH